jgi:hypothetical protein
MREIYKSGITPQQKMVGVNQKFGNTGIKNQQGTSRIIYDSLVTSPTQTNFRFFEDSASRNFPLTNTGSDGNKLGVGDTMVIQSVIFTLFDRVDATGIITNSQNVNNTTSFALAYFDFEIANNKVIKKLTLSEGLPYYDKNTSSDGSDLELETQIVLPPLLPYILELRLPLGVGTPAAGSTRFIQAQIIGTGGIIAPRTTF